MPAEQNKFAGTFVPIPQEGGTLDLRAGAELKGTVSVLGQKTEFLTIVAYAVVITLFIGVAGMFFTVAGILTDSWRFNVTSYIDYQNAQNENDKKFGSVNAELEKMHSDVSNINESLTKIGGQLEKTGNNIQQDAPIPTSQKSTQ